MTESPRRPSLHPHDPVPPARLESWSDSKGMHALIRFRSGRHTEAWLLTLDNRTPQPLFGYARFEHDKTDPGKAMRVPGNVVARKLPMRYLAPYHQPIFGLGDKSYIMVVNDADKAIKSIERPDLPEYRSDLFGASLKKLVKPTFYVKWAEQYGETEGLRSEIRLVDPEDWGYFDEGSFRRVPEEYRLSASLPEVSDIPSEPISDYKEIVVAWGQTDHLPDMIQSILGPINRKLTPESVSFLGRHWTAQAYAFFNAPGREGERRRQAGRLYPAFAPLMASDIGLREAIDAGRPFEPRMRDVVALWLSEQRGADLTVAKLKRFRTYPAGDSFARLQIVIAHACKMPVDWLPTNAIQWKRFTDIATSVGAMTDPMGLDLATILKPFAGPWLVFDNSGETVLAPTGEVTPLAKIHEAKDVHKRFLETVLIPLASLMQHEAGVERPRPESPGLFKEAARILFEGKAAFGILKLSKTWHANLERLEAGIPRNAAKTTWPALIEPFKAANGLEIVALTDQFALTDEGSKRPDPNGVPGLNHCVGGYGKDCFTGHRHILSVRRPDDRSGYQRLSTVEIRIQSAPPAPIEPAVLQHKAYGNTVPNAACEEALEELLSGIRSDHIPVNREALLIRDGADYDAGYDWQIPGNIEQAFQAWAPYLSTNVLAAGVEGLRDRIMPLVASLPAPNADESDHAALDEHYRLIIGLF